MMTKYSSKMHLFIIISCVLIAIGAAVGTICHFLSNGFFNYGADYKSYKTISVSYYVSDYTSAEVDEICEQALSECGVSGYTIIKKEAEGITEYQFAYSADEETLRTAADLINSYIKKAPGVNVASYYTADTIVTGVNVYIWAAVAAASVIAFRFVYTVVRYKLGMAAVGFISDLHCITLFTALMAITRIPLGSYVAPVALMCLILNMFATQAFFSQARSDFKDEQIAKLSSFEQNDEAAKHSFKPLLILCGAICLACLVIAAITAIAAPALNIIAPALSAAVACVVCAYGGALFTPAVYSRFKLLSDNKKSGKKAATVKSK